MDWELIWWCIIGIISVTILVAMFLPWNELYDPKGDDPYRYCPKEEE